MKPFKNAKGSTIKRGGSIAGYKYPIGKVIGGKVYMHIKYIETLPLPEQARIALDASGLRDARAVSYDPKSETYMFSVAPDFDKVSEPKPGKAIKVVMDGDNVDKVFPAKTINQVWHHKWMWVDDNYNGFNVKDAYDWSKTWSSKISNPSGSKPIWLKQLSNAGFPLKGSFGFESLSKEYLNAKNRLWL